MNKTTTIALVILGLVLLGAQWTSRLFFQAPENWPPISYDLSGNALTQDKIDLGRMLFYDPRFSADKQTSCASCHSPYNAFAHTDHATSHGVFDRIGKRNAPPLFNLAWHSSLMWDGAIQNLDMQALAPLADSNEMHSTIHEVIKVMNADDSYTEKHNVIWPGQHISGQHVLQAISAFLITLISDQSKFDLVMHGSDEFTEMEQQGYQLFSTHCQRCHQPPLFSTFEFETNGIPILDTAEVGRAKVTGQKNDLYRFKIPSLRNLDYTFPYMHDGRYKSIRQVIDFYSNNESLHIHLSAEEKVELLAFLSTLNDTAFSTNKNFQYPFHLFNSTSP